MTQMPPDWTGLHSVATILYQQSQPNNRAARELLLTDIREMMRFAAAHPDALASAPEQPE